ncbi:N-acetylglucosamine-6-phosphate deacetylase [Alicyclobacillus fodiniaquatilis]|uniref:N-acetylglucosamine-6-phosphate deacetylase n=1 Tax=Alicyclobacillus fodiniaquatilis TaxID=1661150 RepID=A0ABW4JIB8_9BACL
MKRIEGIHFQTGEPVAVEMDNGVISSVTPIAKWDQSVLPMIAPGLVDLQINGYGGMDFNAIPFVDHDVVRITQALWKEGVTSYFPTVITQSDARIEAAVRTIARVCERHPDVADCIAGIHVEGPFISPQQGARGAHDPQYIKAPDWTLFERWQAAAGGRIKIITLSPEWPEATDFIAKCVRAGVTVSIGHTAATPEQIRLAVQAGARLSTHLGNGAHVMLPRHPNYIWEQLACDELWACVIADGFHLPASVLKVVTRVKGNRAMLVSDAVALAGMPPGAYDSPVGGKVVLSPAGKLSLADTPEILAGSAQMLPAGIQNLVFHNLASLSEAWAMASMRPSSFMQLETEGGLAVNGPADLVLFFADGGHIQILQTYKRGRLVYTG